MKFQSTSLELTTLQQRFFQANKDHQEALRQLKEDVSNQRKLNFVIEDELRVTHHVSLDFYSLTIVFIFCFLFVLIKGEA